MAFKYSCFISYPHDAGPSVDKFVGLLKTALNDRLHQFVDEPITSDHDIQTGAEFNKTIPRAICESVCLLVVYMPVYQRRKYCLQEYTAMERLEKARYEALKQDLSAEFGMILPLIYTGEDRIPPWISDRKNYKNISQFTIAGPEAVFDQTDFKEWLLKVAGMIDSLYDAFKDLAPHPCEACEGYTLPDDQDEAVKARLNIPKAPPESFR